MQQEFHKREAQNSIRILCIAKLNGETQTVLAINARLLTKQFY